MHQIYRTEVTLPYEENMEIKLLNKSINQSIKTDLLSTIDSVLKGTIKTTSLDIYTIIVQRFGEKKTRKEKHKGKSSNM